MRITLLVVFIQFWSFSQSNLKSIEFEKDSFKDSVRRFQLGENTCRIAIMGTGSKIATFVALHENELAATKAYKSNVNNTQNTVFYELKQNGYRHLVYGFKGVSYHFDPNRIFSLIGIKNTVTKCNPTIKTFPPEVVQGIKYFSDSLLNFILPANDGSYVVALHNNTNNNFSIFTYVKKRNASVYVNSSQDIDNFYIVTSKTDFEYFKSINKNVVYEKSIAFDDGSLSIYCFNNSIPYINIEVEIGKIDEQINLINEVYLMITNKLK